jgi:hypothetical protein
LLTLDDELDCNAIYHGMSVLKAMYPTIDGLEHPGLGCFTPRQSLPIFIGARKRFVQIFHQPDHWTCATNILSTNVNEVFWFDSLPKDFISENAVIQLTSMMRHDCANDSVIVKLRKCDRQPNNSVLCGFYALANAAAVCAGKDPTSWQYDSSSIVREVTDRLRNQVLLPVEPKATKRTRLDIAVITTEKLHCLCSTPSRGIMVMCSSCGNWYHEDCVHLTVEQRRQSVVWNGPCCVRRTADDPRANQPEQNKNKSSVTNGQSVMPKRVFTFKRLVKKESTIGPTKMLSPAKTGIAVGKKQLCSTPRKQNRRFWQPPLSSLQLSPVHESSAEI